jgi:cation diffusion facilitator CzcD-associated flavoprotein CzcO
MFVFTRIFLKPEFSNAIKNFRFRFIQKFYFFKEKVCPFVYSLMNTKILVIGCGPSGLASLRAVKEHDPYFYNSQQQLLCLESGSSIGGIWRNNDGFVWNGMLTNLSREKCAFGGFTHEECFQKQEKDIQTYASTSEMNQYFVKFAEKFDLVKHVRLNSKVIKVEKIKNNNENPFVYHVTFQDTTPSSSLNFELTCEKIIFASGVFSVPKIPLKLKQACLEAGIKCAHSCEMRSPKDFVADGDENNKKKKVLIVGSAYSGADIAVAFSQQRNELGIEEVISTCRERGRWFMPRHLKLRQNSEEFVVDAWDRLLETRQERHFSSSSSYITSILSHKDRHDWLKSVLPDPGSVHPFLKINTETDPAQTVICTDYLETVQQGGIKLMKIVYNLQQEEKQETKSIIQKTDSGDYLCTYFDKNDEDGFLSPKQLVEDLKITHVVFATGFTSNLSSFVDPEGEILKPCSPDFSSDFLPLLLYKSTLHPTLTDSIFFVAQYRGPYLTTIDVQARWVGAIINNKCAIPSPEKIQQQIQDQEVKIRQTKSSFYAGEEKMPNAFPHPNFIEFTDCIASEFNSVPEKETSFGKNNTAELYYRK